MHPRHVSKLHHSILLWLVPGRVLRCNPSLHNLYTSPTLSEFRCRSPSKFGSAILSVKLLTDRVCSKDRVLELTVCALSVKLHKTSNLKIVVASNSNLNFPFTSSLFDASAVRRS
jgi:hypothetical protein